VLLCELKTQIDDQRTSVIDILDFSCRLNKMNSSSLSQMDRVIRIATKMQKKL